MGQTDIRKKVFVGLSGGVDSSVSAALLKEAGYDVHGVFIKVWQPNFLPCSATEDRQDAMRVCAALNIPFETLDLEKTYKRDVVDYMVGEYKAGRTPNPDVMCNRYIKFGGFLDYALERGADYIATGHYAQVERRGDKVMLLAGRDPQKDQSYFLWTLTPQQLAHVLFPVGKLHKRDVRKLAERFGLPTAAKKDSQGLCFIGKFDMKEFLAHFVTASPGAVLNEGGEVVGEHDGALFYVLGERHGFRLKHSGGIPYYVVSKDVGNNTITVASLERVKTHIAHSVELGDVNWISRAPEIGEVLLARTRYRQELSQVRIDSLERGHVRLTWVGAPHLAPLGQSMVLYEKLNENLVCRGGGIISEFVGESR